MEVHITYHKNGNRHEEYNLLDNLKHGKCTEYFEDGETIWMICEYNKGLQSGQSTLFFHNGDIHTQGHYENGVKHGEWIEFNKQNKIVNKGKFVHGEKEGFWTEDSLSNGKYEHNKKIGSWFKKRFNIVEHTQFDAGKIQHKILNWN